MSHKTYDLDRNPGPRHPYVVRRRLEADVDGFLSRLGLLVGIAFSISLVLGTIIFLCL